ncbi:MAG: pseudouridine synthase [Actinomycetota bacterium]
MTEQPGERLQKVLSRAGIASRRACEELIRAGRVAVNGRPAELGMRVDVGSDRVTIDDVPVALSTDLAYLALNKPTGVLTAARDARGRTTVVDLVPREPRVFPVGRLDKDTSGLLLLTNDGAFANRMAHPRYEVPKTYVAEVGGNVTGDLKRRLGAGVDLEDGSARAERVEIRARGEGRAVIEMVVREGRNRLVRRMLAAVGLDVRSLVRTAIGPLRLGRLKAGEWRPLDRAEVLDLERSAKTQGSRGHGLD